MRAHDDTVLEQFDPRAQAYLTSAVHSHGPDLERARELVTSVTPAARTLLDVGCGAGHLSFALAPRLEHVVATDPSPSMLATVGAAARDRGFFEIETLRAGAHSLPFGAGAFDVVASRYSAHHWLDVPAALREMRRVLAPGGRLLMIDLLGDDTPLVDTHLQALELLRDPGHVRDFTRGEWHTLLAEAGLEVLAQATWSTRIEFTPWIERMRTPPDSVAAIRRMQAGAPREVAESLAFEPDGSFTPRTALFFARAVPV
jgi:ubiquinone/menaquinone biosynthesis C-methylase UbiE